MAGTLTLSTLSDGTYSTSSINPIRGSARAWVNFAGGNGNTAGTINNSFNVSSITVNGTGDYTANFTNAFSNANYCFAGSAFYAADGASGDGAFFTNARRAAPTTTACRFGTQITNVSYNCQIVSVVFFGS
jgi:hypothetical protein